MKLTKSVKLLAVRPHYRGNSPSTHGTITHWEIFIHYMDGERVILDEKFGSAKMALKSLFK